MNGTKLTFQNKVNVTNNKQHERKSERRFTLRKKENKEISL